MKVPDLVDVQWPRAYRIVNSSFPPIALFEDVLDPEDLEVAYALEALTNDRLIEQAGHAFLLENPHGVAGAIQAFLHECGDD